MPLKAALLDPAAKVADGLIERTADHTKALGIGPFPPPPCETAPHQITDRLGPDELRRRREEGVIRAETGSLDDSPLYPAELGPRDLRPMLLKSDFEPITLTGELKARGSQKP